MPRYSATVDVEGSGRVPSSAGAQQSRQLLLRVLIGAPYRGIALLALAVGGRGIEL